MGPVLRGNSKDARFAFIEAEQDRFGVRYLCRELGVSTSGFYAWRKRPVSKHQVDDEALVGPITAVFAGSDSTYGSPRVHRGLRREDIRISRKRTARLMQENNLKPLAATLYRSSPGTAVFFGRHPNRTIDATTTAPNQILVADITYVVYGKTQMYLAAILDRHTRRALAWNLGYNRDLALTLGVLDAAFKQQPPGPDTIYHSDRGAEYCAYLFNDRLSDVNVLQSTNRPGRLTDNAFMESFWHTLKTECYHGRVFTTENDLRDAFDKFFLRYNNIRMHSSLDYMSPLEYEEAITRTT